MGGCDVGVSSCEDMGMGCGNRWAEDAEMGFWEGVVFAQRLMGGSYRDVGGRDEEFSVAPR